LTSWEDSRRPIVRDAVGVGVAVGSYGVSFGALAVTNGLDLWQALALSTLTFTGGSQFALVSVVGSGGTAYAAVAASLLLGVRNTVYGLRLAPLLQVSGRRRLLAAQLTIDESTAMAVAQPNARAARLGFWATGAAVFVCWNIATVVGALGASRIGDPASFGLDAAVPAALLALVWPQLRDHTTRMVALGAAAVALALSPVFPPGVPVLVAASVAVIAAWPDPRVGAP
jgi:predicted branched-subunit amino acid permease